MSERERIADWLDQRGELLGGVEGLELCITAGHIRRNNMGPNGMAADEPILDGWKPGESLEPYLQRGTNPLD